jgi:uncharacterized protein YfaS (alpha-2-macroglobulin family)
MIISLLLFNSCVGLDTGTLPPADLAAADKLFEKGVFQEALAVYERVFKETKTDNERTKAFFRMCESLTHLFRYGKAADLLLSTPLPAEAPNQARVLLLKAELLKNFLMQYSSILSRETVDNPDTGNSAFSLTRKQIQEEIEKTYGRLWAMKEQLLTMNLRDENYFFMIDKTDFGMYPTLFDFFILSWTNHLTTGQTISEDDLKYVVRSALDLPAPVTPIQKAAELMEKAAQGRPAAHQESSERWHVKRLLLAFASAWKSYPEGLYQSYQAKTLEILSGWIGEFATAGAKAEAALAAANLYNQRGQYSEAVALCEKIINEYPFTTAKNNARALRQGIINPSLSLSVKNMTLTEQKTITISARNLAKVYLRAYKIKNELLARVEKTPLALYELNNGYSSQGLRKEVLQAKADLEWEVATLDKGNHEYLSLTVAPPVLKEGMYLILACNEPSFREGSTLLNSCLVNVSTVMLLSTAGTSTKTNQSYYEMLYSKGPDVIKDSVFHYYTLDAVTGKPVAGANVTVDWEQNYQYRFQTALETGATGHAALDLPVNIGISNYNQFTAYPLAKKGESYSYLQYQTYFYHHSPFPVEILIETDRPIYRPGDKVAVKLTSLRRTPEGFHTLDKSYTILFYARDPNGNIIVEKTITLNDFGSGSFEFEIPKGRLLGSYSLEARCSKDLFVGVAGTRFQVEEYKRPEFEVVFDKNETTPRLGSPAEITGVVKYYFGGPVANANVSYTISRNTYIPWYYRSWFYGGISDSTSEIAYGDIKTDADGKFRIGFTPQEQDAELPGWLASTSVPRIAQYSAKLWVRDEGGRTIEASNSIKVGKNTFYFTIEPEKDFFFQKDTLTMNINRLTVNDSPQAGDAAWEIHLLKNPPLRTWEQMGYSYYRAGTMPPNLPGLDFQFKDVGTQALVAQGTLHFNSDGKNKLMWAENNFSLALIPQGAYRIVLKGKDSDGSFVEQSKVFLVVNDSDEAIPLNITAVTAVEKSEYRVGDTAKILLGSSFTQGTYVLELWAGRFFIKNIFLDNAKPLQVISVPVTQEMKGGFTVRWFGIRDQAIYYGETSIAVPWGEKKLALELSPFKDKLLPGEKAHWGIKTKNAGGGNEPAEVLVLMYDRSLEYYNKTANRGFAGLYLPRPSPENAVDSDFFPSIYYHPVKEGGFYNQLYIDTRLEPELVPKMRTDRTWVKSRQPRGALYMDGAIDSDDFQPVPMVSEETVWGTKFDLADTKVTSKTDSSTRGGDTAPVVPAQIRKEFADTAFFYPHIVTGKSGEAVFDFTAPEQLTSWRIKAIAFTPDVQYGTLESEAVTKKDLMVRLDLPRYFREKDKGTITAMVHNESEQVMSGVLDINVLENGASVAAKIKLTDTQKSFSIKPHSLVSFDWPVEIPPGITSYTVQASAKTATLSDAEERALPILPSRERLIESAFMLMKGTQSKTISIPARADPTRISESVVLQLDPQLALSILNTLPFLVEYPYSCVEQTLNKYVPLAVVNEIYQKYPDVKAAVAKIPHRDTVVPPWEEQDPRRQLEIAETPWGWEARGRPSRYPVIDLLNPAIVAAQKENTFHLLKASQLSGGAFPWWPGGRADLYMTLYVLAGLAEAKRYGVEVDRDMVNNALRYVNNEIPKNFKPDNQDLAMVAYAAFVVTSFSEKEFSEARESHERVKRWLGFLEENVHALTAFGKAWLANTYFRLGNGKRGDEVLAMATDGAREDPIAGVYWTPEEYSWVWYSDTVEKHAFILKTLLEFRPTDSRIEGMVQWLLFNRIGNVWKSTKASACAIYTLLDYLKSNGALTSDEKYTIDWGGSKETIMVKGDEWQKEPLRRVKTDPDIAKGPLDVTIGKEGRGISFASMTWTYSTDQLPEASGAGLIELTRTFFVRVREADGYHLKQLHSGDTVKVGDQIEVRLTVKTRSRFEYMHLKDPKASGFEAETLLSGWKYDPLWFYEEPRDSTENFFVDWLPHGEYALKYNLRPTKAGEYRIGAATLQSMYAPELTAHSAGFVLKVEK